MNRTKSFAILGLNEDIEYSEAEIKKEYRAKMLQYHPDKNHSPDATAKCIEVQDAYNYLRCSEQTKFESYEEMLKSFLHSIFREEASIFDIIFKKIIEYNSDAIIEYLSNINKDTLRIIHSVLSKYRDVLHFSEDLFDRISELLHNDVNACIILNPTLDDLLSEENIYILKHESSSYLVPLWHHEMTFDSDKPFSVKIIPLLPDNMELNESNTLTIRLEYKVEEIWNREVAVDVGGIPFIIHGKELRMTDQPQKIEYNKCGVPYNNIDDIFNCSRKQSIIFIICVRESNINDSL